MGFFQSLSLCLSLPFSLSFALSLLPSLVRSLSLFFQYSFSFGRLGDWKIFNWEEMYRMEEEERERAWEFLLNFPNILLLSLCVRKIAKHNTHELRLITFEHMFKHSIVLFISRTSGTFGKKVKSEINLNLMTHSKCYQVESFTCIWISDICIDSRWINNAIKISDERAIILYRPVHSNGRDFP